MLHPTWASKLNKSGEYYDGFVKKKSLDDRQHMGLGDQETLEFPQAVTRKTKLQRLA